MQALKVSRYHIHCSVRNRRWRIILENQAGWPSMSLEVLTKTPGSSVLSSWALSTPHINFRSHHWFLCLPFKHVPWNLASLISMCVLLICGVWKTESHQYSVILHVSFFLSTESHESMESHEYLSKRLLYYFIEFEVCYRRVHDHFLVLLL